MSGVNKVILVGRVGSDPEFKLTSTGQPVLKFRVATTEKYKDREGKPQESTEWHSCAMFGKRAESLKTYIQKGGLLYIEGKLRTNKYEDKNGAVKYSTSVVVEDIQLLGARRQEGAQAQPKQQAQQVAVPTAYNAQIDEYAIDDDLPF